MTEREQLAKLFPLHFQTIMERHWDWMRAKRGCKSFGLDGPAYGDGLFTLFIWSDTPESHEYWLSLAEGAN